MVGRHSIRTQQSEVFNVIGQLYLFAIYRVSESHLSAGSPGHAEAQSKGLPGGSPPVALFAG